jgi:hypothetical protein
MSETSTPVDVQVFRVLHSIGALAHRELPHHQGRSTVTLTRDDVTRVRLLINLVYRFCSPLCRQHNKAAVLEANVQSLSDAAEQYVRDSLFEKDSLDILLSELRELKKSITE